MAVMKLDWKGDDLKRKLDRIVPEAIDETTQEAAEHAQRSHWWQKRRARGLESEIVTQSARRIGGVWTGAFGATAGAGFYGLFLERKSPFLRPAADATFHNVITRIRRHLK
jgi:hypothetical protein